MRTKKVNVELEEVKVVRIDLDLGNIKQYKSSFLALKNHERNTQEILEVTGFNGSNEVRVVLIIEGSKPEEKELQYCKNWVGQFGKIVSAEVTTAYLLDRDYNDLRDYNLDDNEVYLYN